MVTEDLVPIPGRLIRVLCELQLQPIESGSLLMVTYGKPKGTLYGRLLAGLMVGLLKKSWQRNVASFKEAVEADVMALGGLPARSKEISAESIWEATGAGLEMG